MPDYGLRVTNANGYVQIDSTYKNLALRQKGTVTAGASNGSGYSATITVTAGPSAQLALSGLTAGVVTVGGMNVSGNSITYYLYFSTAGASATYWIFDDPALLSPIGNYGLRVRNANNSVVFDSRFPYMRVIDFIASVNNTNPPAQSTSYASKTIAVVQAQLWHKWTATQTGPGGSTIVAFFVAGAMSVSASSLTLGQQVLAAVTGTTGQLFVDQTPYGGYTFLVLDVTNM